MLCATCGSAYSTRKIFFAFAFHSWSPAGLHFFPVARGSCRPHLFRCCRMLEALTEELLTFFSDAALQLLQHECCHSEPELA